MVSVVATPDTRSSIVVIKSFTWRDAPRLWANRYHFDGPLSGTSAMWTALSDAVVAAESHGLTDRNTIKETIVNDATTASSTNPHGDSVFTKTYSTAGLVSTAGDNQLAGESCAMLRYATDARSTKNKPVYLFNWYHGVASTSGADPDTLLSGIPAAMLTYGAAWIAGFSDGTNTRHRCGPRGAVALTRTCTSLVRHRDFPT